MKSQKSLDSAAMVVQKSTEPFCKVTVSSSVAAQTVQLGKRNPNASMRPVYRRNLGQLHRPRSAQSPSNKDHSKDETDDPTEPM